MDEIGIAASVDLSALGFVFEDKPILVGGGAMEYYGLDAEGGLVVNGDYY